MESENNSLSLAVDRADRRREETHPARLVTPAARRHRTRRCSLAGAWRPTAENGVDRIELLNCGNLAAEAYLTDQRAFGDERAADTSPDWRADAGGSRLSLARARSAHMRK